MLHINIGVHEKNPFSYTRRCYVLPSFMHIFFEEMSAEASRPEGFANLEDCNKVPELLAKELFQIPGVEHVYMEKTLFVVRGTYDINGPDLDRCVIIAVHRVVIASLTMGLQLLDMNIPEMVFQLLDKKSG